ncbi:MAG: TIM barrel protein [Caldilineaceae bacterium]
MPQGVAWVKECIDQLLPVAREYDIVLGLENHYKDGYWRYPEFAQRMDVFLQVLDAIPERAHFGVQYDPSNAIVAGDDPIELLRRVADRRSACTPATATWPQARHWPMSSRPTA